MNNIKVITTTPEELKQLILEALNSSQEQMLTTKQVCDLLQIDRTSVYNYRDCGKLKAYGMGKMVRYKRSEVLAAFTPINGKAA